MLDVFATAYFFWCAWGAESVSGFPHSAMVCKGNKTKVVALLAFL
jgi:hypothetical protein